jgi:hypothetical protein
MLKKIFALMIGVALLGSASMVHASEMTGPVQLTTQQMDSIAAGKGFGDFAKQLSLYNKKVDLYKKCGCGSKPTPPVPTGSATADATADATANGPNATTKTHTTTTTSVGPNGSSSSSSSPSSSSSSH